MGSNSTVAWIVLETNTLVAYSNCLLEHLKLKKIQSYYSGCYFDNYLSRSTVVFDCYSWQFGYDYQGSFSFDCFGTHRLRHFEGSCLGCLTISDAQHN